MKPNKLSKARTDSAGFAQLFHNEITAWIVLGLLITLTVLAWAVAQQALQNRLEARFFLEAENAKARIETRMRNYEQVLRGGAALFSASGGQVDRDQWKAYVISLQLQAQLPGIQGFAYAKVVSPDGLSSHESAVRAEGFPNYRVQPVGSRDFYTSIVYIEPFDARNQRAFGYDMYSEPIRRAAMDLAMNTGTTAISGLVTLRQEDGIDPQPGFLMYLPVYKPNMPIGTASQRRAAIEGFVYSAFRAKDLMKGVLGEQGMAVNFRIYDNQQIDPSALLYSHGDGASPSRQTIPLHLEQKIDLRNREWRVVFEPTPAFLQQMKNDTPLFILLGGGIIDGLLFWVISSLARQRKRQAAQNKVLEESQAKYRGLVAGLKDQFAFFSLAPNGDLTFSSPTLPALLGMSGLSTPQNLLVQARRLYHSGDLVKSLSASLAGQRSTHYVHEHQRPDGTRLVIEGFNSAVRNAQDELISIEGVVQDITERRNGEQELERHRAKLEDLVLERTHELLIANKGKSQFLTNMSHEIRTPLDAIVGINHLMMVDAQDDTQKERLQHVHTEAERLLAMLADVLRFTRLDSEHVQAVSREFDLREVFLNVVNDFQQRIVDKGLSLQHFIDPAVPPKLRGDGGMYRQVLNNLLSNAIKFSDHGQISVELHFEKMLHQTVFLITDVKDEGIGLNAHEFGRLLEPFEQGDNTATRHYGGSGLGLSIANRLALKLGGRLVLQSSSPQGSHLSFTTRFDVLDAVAVEPKTPELETLRPTPELEGRHILVVEDNTLNQQVIKALLLRLGVRVSVCQGGEEAICKVKSDPSVDLVLMDVHMPVVNGMDATRAIRILQSPAAKLPIVALTACALPEDETACQEAGMNGYLTKPVNVPLLRSTLEQLLVKA